MIQAHVLNSDLPVIFVPFYKHVPTSLVRLQNGVAGNIAKKVIPSKPSSRVALPAPQKKLINKTKLPVNAKPIAKKMEAGSQLKPIAKSKSKAKNEIKSEQKAEVAMVPESDTTTNAANTLEPILIGRQDLELLQLQELLQETVSQVWQPPLGLDPELEMVAEVSVNWQGKLTDLHAIKPSGVLIYDSSIILALEQAEWPKESWGKKHMLTFKP